ncbi:MAG: ribose transport system permease protein [Pseudonocardiales bacterium]|nr:ribose transport system permease protein [Pseudonocardiales bacterium]
MKPSTATKSVEPVHERPPVAQRRWSQFVARFGLLIAWAVVFLVFSVLPKTADVFPTVDNVATILGSQAVIAVLTLALVVPLIAGDYDLSVAFTLTLSSMLIAVLNVEHGWPILAAVGIALLAGAVVGVVNAATILYFRIDSLIVTLGTGTFIGGIVLWMSDSNTISGISPGLVEWVIVKRIFNVPIAFYYVLALALAMWYVFELTPLGRRMLFVGRGRNVARLSGVNVERVRLGGFVVSGVIAAFGGVIYSGTTGAADPTSGTQLLLPAFAAAFLGATTIYPGRFNPLGALAAVYFLVTGITGFQLLGAQSYVQQLFYGGALVLAVALSQLARKRQALEAGTG